MIVSVCVITYNHESYIGECLESILNQKTQYPFEIIIGEDQSTDNTRRIIEKLAATTGKIKLLPTQRNLGMMPNFIKTLGHCTGQYIALCEGDDYWADSYKIQKQVDFLESHPGYTICFSDTGYLNQVTGEKKLVSTSLQRTRTINQLLKENFIATQTVMYRNIGLKIPMGFDKLQVGDWPLHVLYAQFGKIGHIKESTAVYRIHENNNWNGVEPAKKMTSLAEAAIFLSKNIKRKYRPLARKQALRYIHYLVDRHLQEKDFEKANEKSRLIYQLPFWWLSLKTYFILFKIFKR